MIKQFYKLYIFFAFVKGGPANPMA